MEIKFKKASLKQVVIYKVNWLICMIKMVCMIRGGYKK